MYCLVCIKTTRLPSSSPPAGPERTVERIELYYASEDVAQAAYDDMRAVNTAMWKKVFEEDIQVVEGMQKGRHAPLYDGGKFSSMMDTPTHHFHKWVASEMLEKATERANNRRATKPIGLVVLFLIGIDAI